MKLNKVFSFNDSPFICLTQHFVLPIFAKLDVAFCDVQMPSLSFVTDSTFSSIIVFFFDILITPLFLVLLLMLFFYSGSGACPHEPQNIRVK